MPVILPKSHVTSWPGPLFFLAGPVRGGGDWQYDAYQLLEKKRGEHVTAAIPMRYPEMHPLCSKQLRSDPAAQTFNRQLAWERHYLTLTGLRSKGVKGCLVFWLANESKALPHPGPEPYAMDTRREIGEWYTRLEFLKEDVRLVVGVEDRFHGASQIERCLTEARGSKFPVYRTLHDTIQAAVLIGDQ